MQAAFPSEIRGPVQFGQGLAAWTVYLSMYQMLPLARIGQLFADLTGHRPSEATLLAHLQSMHTKLIPHEQFIRGQLLAAPVGHADETGVQVEGKRQWLHTVSTAKWTYQAVHYHRGTKAFDAMGILPNYRGILVHDCNMPYFKDIYNFRHALCVAHLLRECQGITEYDKHRWSTRMRRLLQTSWRLVKLARATGGELPLDKIRRIEKRYDSILDDGEPEWLTGRIHQKTGPRGRKSKSKAANLAERFRLHKTAVLRFLRDPRVPFDNNQAERDIRMTKVKQKISGTFRTLQGAEQFARVRGFISTLRKQNLPILHSLIAVLRCEFSFQ
ncbi:IS66 family transposase [Paenibacillus gorillae]|uniref:IS66 family transposase n=1 Tax=Paenibacillus gorillae TaxID=1243662 RepID=UPI001EE3975A|nr:IS66 family transposase [Paenibacillus gorillae]